MHTLVALFNSIVSIVIAQIILHIVSIRPITPFILAGWPFAVTAFAAAFAAVAAAVAVAFAAVAAAAATAFVAVPRHTPLPPRRTATASIANQEGSMYPNVKYTPKRIKTSDGEATQGGSGANLSDDVPEPSVELTQEELTNITDTIEAETKAVEDAAYGARSAAYSMLDQHKARLKRASEIIADLRNKVAHLTQACEHVLGECRCISPRMG